MNNLVSIFCITMRFANKSRELAFFGEYFFKL
jgi:hypothetical protein